MEYLLRITLILVLMSNGIIRSQVEIDKAIQLTGGAGERRLSNLEAPVNNTDAANKEYVDNAVAGTGGNVVPDTTYTLSGTKLLTANYGGTTFTVPAGKIWAIQSSLHTSNISYPPRITNINGQSYNYGYLTGHVYTGNNVYPIVLPFFLKPGTVFTVDVGNSAGQKALISVAEYKIAVQP